MTKFKAILLLTVGLALFPKLASASMMPEQYPWPWPWAIGCPIRWTDLQGDHAMLSNPRVSQNPSDDRYEIRLFQSSPSDGYDVKVRRFDGQGLHSEGHQYVGKGRLVFTLKMMSYREHRWYKIKVRMGMPNSDQPNKNKGECDDKGRVKTVIQVLPDHRNQQGSNFIVEPIGQN